MVTNILFLIFDIDNEAFEKALLEKYGIKNCVVRLERLAQRETSTEDPPKNLRLSPQKKPLRSNVSWMPVASSTLKHSSDAVAALATYREEIDFVPSVTKNNVIRQRAKSVYVESVQLNDSNESNVTMDDLHFEFRGKYNSPNRGLKPVSVRQLPEAQPKPTSQFQLIYNEFLEKLAAKKANIDPK